MKPAKIFGKLLWLILIVGAMGNGIFGQNLKTDERQMQHDVKRLTREIKIGKHGAYLLRSKTDYESGTFYFEMRKILWSKLNEEQKLAIARDWWSRWRLVRGTSGTGILSLQIAGAEEIVCIMDRCYVPACEL